jgi:hypothetical protein
LVEILKYAYAFIKNYMKKFFFFLLIPQFIFSQEKAIKFEFSGYVETYYSFDFNQPDTNEKLPFMYNYNRHNEFNLNIGLLRAKAEYDNSYAVLTLQAGTYVEDNYANETTKFINEAYVGLFLDKAKKSTIELGILPSYIGFETATSASNLTLTRSILAENSPYFMTGIKYTYKPNEKFTFSGLVTNGWQRINKPDKDSSPALGSQIIYKPSDKSVFNWSTFIGKEFNGTAYSFRYFSNLYWDYKWNNKWRTITGFDYGLQESSSSNNKLSTWLSPVFIAQYSINPKWQTAFRAEYYQDKKNIIIAINDSFETLGFSLNFDYLPNSKVKFRTEARYLKSNENIFLNDEMYTNNDFFLTTSLSLEL